MSYKDPERQREYQRNWNKRFKKYPKRLYKGITDRLKTKTSI